MEKVLIYSQNNYLITLLRAQLVNNEIKIKHCIQKDEIHTYLFSGNANYIACLLDLPNPTKEDINFWENTIKTTEIPILLLHSFQNNSKKILSRQNATLKLTSPIMNSIYLLKDFNSKSENFNSLIPINSTCFLDISNHCIINNDENFPVSVIEFKLLYLLTTNCNKCVEIDDLLNIIDSISLESLYVHIKNLRKKIEYIPSNPKTIVTIRGKGYMLCQ